MSLRRPSTTRPGPTVWPTPMQSEELRHDTLNSTWRRAVDDSAGCAGRMPTKPKVAAAVNSAHATRPRLNGDPVERGRRRSLWSRFRPTALLPRLERVPGSRCVRAPAKFAMRSRAPAFRTGLVAGRAQERYGVARMKERDATPSHCRAQLV